jgi:uridine monophosphate synthetase
MDRQEKIAEYLLDTKAVKLNFDEPFTYASGIRSPIYCDNRVLISHPEIRKGITQAFINIIKENNLEFDVIAGVATSGIPWAAFIAAELDKPMIYVRSKTKGHGMTNLVEGAYQEGDKAIVIEDLISTGGSSLTAAKGLKEAGIIVNDLIAIFTYKMKGAQKKFEDENINLHTLSDFPVLIEKAVEKDYLNSKNKDKVLEWNQDSKNWYGKYYQAEETPELKVKNPVFKKLQQIMQEKKSNLCVAADLTTTKEVLNLVEKIGDKICLLKTHIDIIEDFTPEFITQLKKLAEEKNFLLFEDRKFADIGNTVKHQFENGIYHIADWADMVNAHVLPGPGIIEGLKNDKVALILLQEMSSAGNLLTPDYTKKAQEMAQEYSDYVIGFIGMNKTLKDPRFMMFTPGVKLEKGTDKLGQQYNDVESAIKKGTDIIIVGRGIYQAEDPRTEAQKYQELAWKTYNNK